MPDPAPSVPPVPDGLADRLRAETARALRFYATRTDRIEGMWVEEVAAHVHATVWPWVAAALASPPAAGELPQVGYIGSDGR